tara:strand:- start:14 stop:187 length:174 start_codon:yes stop_codon:yes gene_type:complete
VNKLEQEAKNFLANKNKINNEKLMADVKSVIASLESVQLKLKEIQRLVSLTQSNSTK